MQVNGIVNGIVNGGVNGEVNVGCCIDFSLKFL